MRILVADDDPLSQEIVSHVLMSAGYDVRTANNGVEALDKIRTEDIRFVISDIDMPRMDGLTLSRQIRNGRGPYTFIILLTSHHGSAEVVAGLAAGADDYISKPFDASELVARVRVGQRVLRLETQELTIFALAKLAESRDPETGKHLERVQRYAQTLARRLAYTPQFHGLIDDDFVRLIFLTAPLHDIGKVGIPDNVLLKPGKLTTDEFTVMKQHTAIGAKSLEAALDHAPGAKFLEMGRDIATFHHERWDGLGYPFGISGANIPLAARIVALADVYDALASKRVYKPEYSHEKCRDIILQGAGTQFDPQIVDAFRAVESDFVQIRGNFCDSEDEHTRSVSFGLPTMRTAGGLAL